MSEPEESGEEDVETVAYTPVVADLFHYGHLNVLMTAHDFADYHVSGVITDEAANTYRPDPISNFEERRAVVESVEYVDEVVAQNDRDPTDNLRELHERYPDAEILLVHGDDWEKVPGRRYVETIGGRVVQPSYYERLSDEKIANEVKKGKAQSQRYELFTEHFKVGDIEYFDGETASRKILSTKADTLKSLQPLLDESRIEKTFVFNVGDWQDDSDSVIDEIQDVFLPDEIVVRSSSVNEDTLESSNAGNFESCLGVSSTDSSEIRQAVNEVIGSYEENGTAFVDDQVLVQRQTQDVELSGVVFTRQLENNAPYYVINYDETTGKTDTVTGGYETEKIKIFRGTDTQELPERWRTLIDSVREIEDIVPDIALDIEFGMSSEGEVTIFQVRPLTVNASEETDVDEFESRIEGMAEKFEDLSSPVDSLAGDRNEFSDMAFWNPAEIIGDSPNRLAYSLYSYLITDEVWHRALEPLGYTDVGSTKLMVRFGDKPYIDLRATFNALTPAAVSSGTRKKLVEHYFGRLNEDPALHDKIEFRLVYNCYEFGLSEDLQDLQDEGFTREEINELRNSLHDLTDTVLLEAEGIVEDAESNSLEMENRRLSTLEKNLNEPEEKVRAALELLDDCKEFGTLSFSKLARMAFIGKALLKSMVDLDVVDEDTYQGFLRSIETVASEFECDFDRYATGDMSEEEFLNRYGHLRPGTYEISVPTYANDPELIEVGRDQDTSDLEASERFELTDRQRDEIREMLDEEGFSVDVDGFLWFVRESIKGREKLKFEFTKNLSHAMELIAEAGEDLGLERDEISHLDLATLRTLLNHSNVDETVEAWRNLVETRRSEKTRNERLMLPPVIFSETDFYVVPTPTVRPNYVTDERVDGEVVNLDETEDKTDINNKIVLIENADPGYDWIFTKDIKALITKHGGEASHMAIRSAEFGLPAAIGCGESLYSQAKRSNRVLLDCEVGKMEFQ